MNSRVSPTQRALRLVAATSLLLAVLTLVAGRSDAGPSSGATPGVTLVRQSTEVAPDGVFTAVLSITDAPAGGDLAVDIYDRVTRRDDLPGGDSQRASGPAATFEPIPLTEGSTQQVQFSIHLYDRGQQRPADAGGWAWRLSEPGVYPIRVRLRDADGANVRTTFTYLVRAASPDAPSEAARVALTVVLAPGSPDDDTLPIDRVSTVLDVLGRHPDVPLTFSVDPDLLEATAASADGRALVSDIATLLRRSRTELLAAPFTDIDPAELVAADLADTIGGQSALGDATLHDRLGRSGSSTWLLTRPLDVAALFALRAAGVEHAVVPPTSLIGDAPLAPTPLVGVDESFTVVSTASDLPAGGVDDPNLAAHTWFARSAALATIAGPAGSGTVARIDASTVDADLLGAVLDIVDSETDRLHPMTVQNLFGTTTSLTTPMALTPPSTRPLDAYRRARAEVTALAASFATMVTRPTANETTWNMTLARSERAGLREEARIEMLAGMERSLRSTFTSITTSAADRITLGARDATFPLSIESTADFPLRVLVHMSASSRIDLPHNDFVVVVPPGRTTVPIRVRTRTSGDIPLQVQLLAPDRSMILAESRYSIRSTAVSGMGIILTLGAAGFLSVWWARHIWRSRRGGDGGRLREDVTGPASSGSDPSRPGTHDTGPTTT